MKTNNKFLTLFLGLTVTACTYDFPEESQPVAGEADFSKTVVVGSSLSAGFMNGALYDAGQQASFSSILAHQMLAVDGGAFNQPDINAVDGFYGIASGIPGVPDGTILGRLYLKGAASPKPTPKIPGQAITDYAGDKTALNNFSAYGVTIQTAQTPFLGGPSGGNPYFNRYYNRFASNPGISTLLGDAQQALIDGGTFLVFWLGNDDVLGYATNGADQNDPTKPLTGVSAFTGAYNNAITTLLDANDAVKGAVANIPDITSLPYFTTVVYNAIPLDGATASALNAGYEDFNNGIKAYNAGLLPGQSGPPPTDERRDTIGFKAGNNTIVIEDEYLPDLTAFGIPSIRQTKTDDLICFPAASVLGVDMGDGPKGLQDPLEDKYIIVPQEKTDILTAISDFNSVIAQAVTDNTERLVLVDVNSILKSLKTSGALIRGSSLTASISPPFGGFSLDGVHPNARGNGYLANQFIETINSKFKSNIPLCNPNNYPGNDLPVP